MRMIVEFCKGPAARFISHLDLMRAVQRALRHWAWRISLM